MKEFKFRAWNNDKEEMILIDGFDKTDIYYEDSKIYPSKIKKNRTYFNIMQWTGLQDKNGTDIYEGDIVIEKSYPMYNDGFCNYRCVVLWDKEQACFYLNMVCVSNRVRGCACADSICEYSQLEIIGNIYENPELLEE